MVSTAPEVVTEQATSPLSQSAVEPIILRPPESWLTNEAAMLEL